jgi:RHS repeat-associated protein
VNIPKINYPVDPSSPFLGTLYYNYRYDQLNRITAMNTHMGALNSGGWVSWMWELDDYKERVSYDANGNILKYTRKGTTLNSKPLAMDSLTYHYYTGTNRLQRVTDAIPATNYTEDIDNQTDVSNYMYDEIGNLIQDKAEQIDSIKWNVYGKISEIRKDDSSKIVYTYDAGGNRISKKLIDSLGNTTIVTWYVRDATGNVMSVYTAKNDTIVQDEIHLYGSSRLGILKPGRNLTLDEQYGETIDTLDLLGIAKGGVFRRGQKFFELANHLGNVLVTISDKKLGIDTNGDSTVNYYMADVMTANDYYPFGMGMPERRFAVTNAYRYGFNGKENDNEVKGGGNQQDYGMRVYDPRLGKFLSVDPIADDYPELTPYQFASNRPIDGIDQDGLEFVERIVEFSFKSVSAIDQNADRVRQKKIDNPGYKYTTAEKISLWANGVSKSTPFGVIHQVKKQINAIKNAPPEQRKQLRDAYLDKATSLLTRLVTKGPIDAGVHATAETLAPTVQGVLDGDPEALGELTGVLGQGYFTRAVLGPPKLPGFKVDLMGGPNSKMGSAWINFDKAALSGIKDDVANFGKHFGKGSVTEMTVSNPLAEFLVYVSESMKKGGTITIRGQISNKFFKNIWEGKAKGLEGFEVVPGSKKTGLSTSGYNQSSGAPLQGTNNINEIILRKI